MDARILQDNDDTSLPVNQASVTRIHKKPGKAEAEAAVRTLLVGRPDPDREGLLETPKRVAKAYQELFGGYSETGRGSWNHFRGSRRLRRYGSGEGYFLLLPLRTPHGADHPARRTSPICREADVVGLSKMRVSSIFCPPPANAGKHPGADCRQHPAHLQPRGVRRHDRGGTYVHVPCAAIRKQGSSTITTTFTGDFKEKADQQVRFMTLIRT